MISNFFINPEEHRPRALWRLIIQVVLFIAGNLILSIPLGMGAGLILAATGADITDPQAFTNIMSHPMVNAAGGIASLVAMFASYFIAARWIDRRPFKDFGFHLNAKWWLDFGFGLFLGAFLMVLIFLVELSAGWITITGTLQSARADTSFWTGIASYVILFFCVGIYEEMLSRGYQLRNLAEGLNFKGIGPRDALLLAYLLSSSVFGLLHLGNQNSTLISTLSLIVAGLFLGLGYVLTGELALPIGLHMTWNFFQGNVFGFPVSGSAPAASFINIQQGGPDLLTGGAFGPEAGVIGLTAIALGALLIIAWVNWRHGRTALQERLAVYLPRPGSPAAQIVTPQSDLPGEGPAAD